MAEIHTLKPQRDVLIDVIAKDIDECAKEAKDEKAIGFAFIFQTGDKLVLRARINGNDVYRFVGFIETDVKSTLIALMKGDG